MDKKFPTYNGQDMIPSAALNICAKDGHKPRMDEYGWPLRLDLPSRLEPVLYFCTVCGLVYWSTDVI